MCGGGIEENVEFCNEFLEGITSYLKICNQLNFLVTRHFELVTRYAKIEFPGSGNPNIYSWSFLHS